MTELKVVILCGGTGTRLREHTEYIPKALVQIGNMPILLHIMKIYSFYGYNKFILCLGYKGEMIKDFFMNYELMSNDFRLKIGQTKETEKLTKEMDNFEITFADTGLETPTGGRIKKIEKYVNGETFFATYSDGLADINLHKLLEHHKRIGKIATLTAVNPMSPFGIVEEKDGVAVSFKEKPMLPGLINGGFFVFNSGVFDYLHENSVLEEEPLRRLTAEGQLAVHCHKGFWACMDTFKDVERLNALWKEHVMPHTDLKVNKPPWKIWD
jgi:glucose-1-phosphate cytidylyltransferase